MGGCPKGVRLPWACSPHPRPGALSHLLSTPSGELGWVAVALGLLRVRALSVPGGAGQPQNSSCHLSGPVVGGLGHRLRVSLWHGAALGMSLREARLRGSHAYGS